MVKGQQILPGQRILLAGSGPFLMPVAKGLVEAGASVVAVAEATRLYEWLPYSAQVWGHWHRLSEALTYERFLRRAGVPRYYGHLLVRAEGSGKVERATIAAVTRDWRPRTGTEKTFDVDLVCIGYGYDRPWRLRSWDRFAIPLPFSRCVVTLSEPVHVDPSIDFDGTERPSFKRASASPVRACPSQCAFSLPEKRFESVTSTSRSPVKTPSGERVRFISPSPMPLNQLSTSSAPAFAPSPVALPAFFIAFGAYLFHLVCCFHLIRY